MIYLFRIISDERPDFMRDLVIQDTDSFLDFHRTLQKNLGYDQSQLASFFITNESWEKNQEITLIDMEQDSGDGSRTMEETHLGDLVREENQRMIYVFDFFSERAFFMELIEYSDQVSQKSTPFIGYSQGDPPPQLKLDMIGGDEDPDMEDPDPGIGGNDIRLDDIDPDQLDSDFPEDM